MRDGGPSFAVLSAGPYATPAEVVGPRRVVRAAAPAVDRLERLLAASRAAHRSLSHEVATLDCAAYHGQSDAMKVLKKRRLREKDRIYSLLASLRALRDSTPAWELGSGSFGKVLLGRASAAAGGGLVAIKVEATRKGREGLPPLLPSHTLPPSSPPCRSPSLFTSLPASHAPSPRHSSLHPTNSSMRTALPNAPLAREACVLRSLGTRESKAFPRMLYFGRQRLIGEPADVLVMELLGPSVEEM